jgi:peptidyl-prolyl cis-trans isomerase SurA
MNRKTVACVCLLIVAICANEALCAEVYSDRVAAVVNGDVILESDIRKHKQSQMRKTLGVSLGIVPPGKVPTEKEILDELIVIRLLEQEADKRGIKVDDKGVQATIESIKERRKPKLTQDEFILSLAVEGLTYAEYRDMLRKQLKLTKLIAVEVQQKVPLSEEDAQLYFKKNREDINQQYQKLIESLSPPRTSRESTGPEIPTHITIYVGGKVRLRQIVLKIPSRDKKTMRQVMAKAKKIYHEAVTGVDFAQLAKKHSEDSLASKGGDLGFMNYKDLVPQLQKVVQRMKEGDVFQPLEGRDSIIIFYLDEAKNRQMKQEPIPEKIRKQLEEQLKKSRGKRQTKPRVNPESDDSRMRSHGDDAALNAKNSSGKKNKILTPAEEKEYRKVRNKVISILRTEKIQARLKEWVEELKKSSIIEVKI